MKSGFEPIKMIGRFLCAALLTLFSGVTFAQLTQLTNLPTLYITTQGGQAIQDKVKYVPGALKVVAGSEITGQYDGAIEIRLRGNATYFLPKKPYRIKLASKTRLLGMPANERSWVLLANYVDNTLIRNALAFEMSKYMGLSYTCSYRLVDVYLNGAYIGNYTLTDQVGEGNDRVVMDKLDNTITTQPDLSGGYLVQSEIYADQEPSYFRTTRGMAFSVKYPDDEDIIPTQFNYIRDYIKSYETKLYATDFLHATNGYRPLNDRESQVNWFIASELSGNPDSFLSIFMFKKRNDAKIYFGPLWDFDLAFNNNYDKLGADATYKRISCEAYGTEFPKQMLLDPEFKSALKTRWNQLKALGIEGYLDDKIVSLYSQIGASQVRNKQIWNYNNPTNIPNFDSRPYSQFIEELRAYMKRRVAYMDQQLNDVIRSDMYYKLLNRTTGKVIDIKSLADQSLVQKTASSSLSQQWQFTPVEVGGVQYFKIENRDTKKFISVPDNTAGHQLKANSASNNDSQLWKAVPAENNIYYGFVNKSNSWALENLADNASEGNQIIQFVNKITTDGEQQWTFVPFEAITPPLPVSVVRFQSKPENTGIKLTWEVTENINGNKFVVQRNSDPSRFKPDSIGQVAIHDSGLGNYNFFDPNPQPGNNYYRLKIVDLDGSVAYSRYIRENHFSLQDINIFPQPAAESATVWFKSQSESPDSKIEILNLAGKTVSTMPIPARKGNNQFEINTKNLSPGVYEILFIVDDQFIARKLLVSAK